MIKKATLAFIAVVALAALAMPVQAQCDMRGRPITSLRDPLIYGATSTAPLRVAPHGQPPPVGDSFLSPPVTPGHAGMWPTVIPSVPITPSNDISNPSVQIYVDPYNQSAPGELGPSTWAPPSPSTPGDDPGILHAPLDFIPPPARVGSVAAGGGIVGGASDERWGGQTTADFGPYRHRGKKTYDNGEELPGQSSEDGFNHARQDAQTTQDLYGDRFPIRDNGRQIVQTVAPY